MHVWDVTGQASRCHRELEREGIAFVSHICSPVCDLWPRLTGKCTVKHDPLARLPLRTSTGHR